MLARLLPVLAGLLPVGAGVAGIGVVGLGEGLGGGGEEVGATDVGAVVTAAVVLLDDGVPSGQMVGLWHRYVMAADPVVPAPNPVQLCDAEVLVGVLAILEGVIWSGDLDARTTRKVAERFVEQGLLAADHDQRHLRQAIGDMNQRLRYAAGEYDSPPPPVPLPP